MTRGDKRKETGDGAMPPAKGQRGRKPATAPSPAAVEAALESPPQSMTAPVEGDVVTVLESDVPKTVLHCDVCDDPLKPPVYQCSRMHHVACSDCGGGECRPCADLAASAVYVKNAYLDTLFGYTKVACPYKKYGCASSVAYRDAAAHAAACPCAPCSCPVLECLFEGSPADLVRHLTEESGRHAWTAHKITYGKEHRYVVHELKSEEDCQKLLVAEEDDGVFLLDIVRNKDFFVVNLLCVGNKAGTVPVYSSSVAVEGPPAKGLVVKLEKKVVASCPTPATLEYEYSEALPVLLGLLHGEQTQNINA